MISERGTAKNKRISCELMDDDGHVIGRAYVYSSKNNDRFVELACNTNDACYGIYGTLRFDEMGLGVEE